MVLGSVSQSVLHDAHCPVAVVKASDEALAQRVERSEEHPFHLPVPPVREHL
jgi:hypothetical protein